MNDEAAERLTMAQLQRLAEPLDAVVVTRRAWESVAGTPSVLDAERKATVERIRAAVLAYWDAQHPGLEDQTEQWAADLWADRNDLEGIILDAEAAREA